MNTIGELYGPAMEIIDQAEADAYFEKLVSDSMKKWGQTRAEAVSIQKQNLGYYAGYYSDETRQRVERLFKCCHPIFGSIETHGSPSPEEAFKAGLEAGRKPR